MSTPEVFDIVKDYAQRHGTDPKLDVDPDTGIWMVEIDSPKGAQYSGTGYGVSPQDAYAHLVTNLGLSVEEAA